ncbi:hypothetical protein [Glutamicibacter protophormiae]|uniref:hypothetical protein n=1 Tax=Glutamicibacter protophormiae TaxID=37930 RepID=UPI003A938C54
MSVQEAAGESAYQAQTLLLLPHTVTDLADFTANPDRYLVSIEAEPDRAAKRWFQRAAKNPYGGDGVVQIRYFGTQLIPSGLWDDTVAIWMALLDAVEGFLSTGKGRGSFNAEISLAGNLHTAGFWIGGALHRVAPLAFIPAVLGGSKRYFDWLENRVGRTHPGILERIEAMQRLLESFSPTRAVPKESGPRA